MQPNWQFLSILSYVQPATARV
ncbi:Protein of unknown function [Leuconostoc citreum LBAE C11]|nr:Protein of unknown function [Leuconostoc citreum LBAE C10]CCF26683.1 Protein of unknown function [Leuconostoc citreum LBAE C11]